MRGASALHTLVWVSAVGASLALRAAIPPYLDAAPHDDGLMTNMAYALINGQWLGAWNYLTLVKPPGYPLLLAGSHWLHASPALIVQVLYLVGSAALAFGIRAMGGRRLATLVFVLLALNPVMFGTNASRLYRNGLLAAQVVIVVACAIWLGRLVRRGDLAGVEFAVAVVFGFTTSWIYITKADVLLYVIPSGTLFLAGGWLSGVPSTHVSNSRRSLVAIGSAVFALTAGITPVFVVLSLNVDHYGIALLQDSESGPVAGLMRTWASVETGQPPSNIAVSQQAREDAYRVSAATRTLRPFLDPTSAEAARTISPCRDAHVCTPSVGPPNWPVDTWRVTSCARWGRCDDSTTLFPFALRDALMLASGGTREAFYRLATAAEEEIQAACDSGRLTCGAAPIVTLPSANQWEVPSLRTSLIPIIRSSIEYLGADTYRAPRGIGTEDEIVVWSAFAALDVVDGAIGAQPTTAEDFAVHALRWSYSKATWLLLFPALVGAVWATFRTRSRPFALLALGSFIGWALEVGVLTFLETNQGGYILAAPNYLIAATPLLIIGLSIGTWLATGQLSEAVQRWKA